MRENGGFSDKNAIFRLASLGRGVFERSSMIRRGVFCARPSWPYLLYMSNGIKDVTVLDYN